MRHRYTQVDFLYRCMFPRWRDWDIKYTPKGQRQRRRARALQLVVLVLVGLYLLSVWRRGFTPVQRARSLAQLMAGATSRLFLSSGQRLQQWVDQI